MGARPTKYTPDRVERILNAIAVGTTKKLAAQYGGVDAETLLNWEKKYPEFKAQMLEAEGRAAVGWLALIEKAAKEGTWQAAAWKLERLHADDYGRTVSEQRHSGAITLLSADQLQELSDDEFSAYQARLREGPGGPGGGTAAPRLRLAEG